MTIEQIAQRLNDCANVKCNSCSQNHIDNTAECQTRLIQEMANECRKIVAESDPDTREAYLLGVSVGIDKSIDVLEQYKNEKFVDTYVVQECIDELKKIDGR